MCFLKYSVMHFSTAYTSVNSRIPHNILDSDNIKTNQYLYIDLIYFFAESIWKSRTFQTFWFFFLTITRSVLTTISLFLAVSNVKLIVWRPNSSGSILNVTGAEEPPSRFLRLQLCILDPAVAESKAQIPFPAAILTQNCNVEGFYMFHLHDRYNTREILKPLKYYEHSTL